MKITPTAVPMLSGFLLIVFCAAAAPLHAQITFSDFSNVSTLALNGSAAQATNGSGQKVLRLTRDGQFHKSGTAWFMTQQQSVSGGFTTTFQFQITHLPTNGAGPADGISFVIQNSSGAGFGTAARGGSGGAIGYGAPDPGDNGVAIPNSLAIELDTFQNSWDPNNNHIAVQSCGTAPNSQSHNGACNLGIISNLNGITLADGNVHTIVIDYDPGPSNTAGPLRVFLDDVGTPVLTVTTNLSTLLSLNSGSAWVGFGGSTGGDVETNDLLNWTFTPATAHTSITETIIPNNPATQTNNFVFGSYNHKVQYNSAQGADTVTVTAIPIDQTTFFNTRLSGSDFLHNHPGTQCAIYEGTGSLCVVFEVTCTDAEGSSDCETLNYDLFNNFNTQQTISGACLLKTPVNTNNWANIIETFTQTRTDPGTKSRSNGFSDFVLGQNCTSPPTFSIATPQNGGVYPLGPLTLSFLCLPDPDAPGVMTSCSGTFNGNPVNSGDTVTLTTLGAASLTVNATDSVGNSSSQISNFTVGRSPAFTSASSVTFQTGVFGSFLVSTSGLPAPSIVAAGGLPGGVTFMDNGNGTATLAGTPVAGSGNVYPLAFTATNTLGSALQSFMLTVNQAPAITSASSVNFPVSVFSSFTVTATGFPTPSISDSGTLPSGVTFTSNGNGTATLSGTPANVGTFNISFTASNVAGATAQNFTLTTSGPQVSISPTSINFGTVTFLSLLWKNVTITNVGTASLQIGKIAVALGPGADKDDYTLLNFCKSTLSPGKSCVVTVFFLADDLGSSSATLDVFDNAPASPQQVSLSANVVKRGH